MPLPPGQQATTTVGAGVTGKHIIMVVAGALVAGLALGALAVDYFHRPSSIVVQSDKVDEARKVADTKEIAVVKEAVTKRRAAAKRVADEVQREVTSSDLADYLGAHAASGSAPPGGDPDRSASAQGDDDSDRGHSARDGGDPLAPGAP